MPCTSCGLNDHRNFYDIECPDFIPIDQRPRQSTICVSAAGRFKHPTYRWIIEKAADDASLVASRALLLLHAYYAKVLGSGNDVEALSENLFRKAYSLVQDTRTKPRVNVPSAELIAVYESCFSGIPRIASKGLGNVNNYMIKGLMTTCEQYNTFEILLKHVKLYLLAKYELNKTHAQKIASMVVRLGAAGEFRDNASWNEIVVEEWQRFSCFFAKVAASPRDPAERSLAFLRYRRFLLATIENMEGVREKEFSKFHLLPVLKEGRRFITLDKIGLRMLAANATSRRNTKDEKAVIKEKFRELEAFFDFGGLARGQKWKRGVMVRTNGTELHVVFGTTNVERLTTGRLKRRKANLVIRPEDLDPSYRYDDCVNVVGDSEFIAIDPGNYSPFTWVRKKPGAEGQEQKIFSRESISKRWYNLRSKRLARTNRHKADVGRFGLKDSLEALAENHLKHAGFAEIRIGVRVRLQHQISMHNAFSNKQRLKLRFEARIAEKKAIDQVITRMRGGPNGPVKLIAFGDGSRMHGMRGTTVGAPNARIKRHAVRRGKNEGFFVKLEDEFRTSKMSSCCVGSEMKCIKTSHPPRGYTGPAKTFRVNGICRCQNCHKLFARDVNAAINIWQCVHNRLHQMDRPSHLARTSTQASSSHTHDSS